ncbi:MAG: penicillin-binding transpeptidase domain-containing protein, partial [bacterium]
YPGESRGSLRPVSKWQGTERFSFSYGYGYTSTALQLAAAVNVVANKGVYVAPKMVLKTTDKDGVETASPASETRQVLSASTAQIMTSLMTDVVCYGTGKLAKMPGLSVAG